VLLDVRTLEEYQGNPRIPRSGHIPKAKWWPWDDTVALKKGFTIKSRKVLDMSLEKLGIDGRDVPLVTYCQTGHRAAQAYLVLRHLGFNNIRLYDGSMAEYTQRRGAALVKGVRP